MTEESTTRDALELVRGLFEAANRRAWAEVADLFARESVLDLSDLGLGAYEGADAISAFVKEWIGAYDEWEAVMAEVLELDNGVVFTVNQQVARPTGSSVVVEARQAIVSIVRDGEVERGASNTDRDQSRADAERLAEERG